VVIIGAVSCENSSNSVEPLQAVNENVSNQQAVNLENQTIDKEAYAYALGENGEAISTEVLTTAIEIEAVFSEEIIEELQNSFVVEITDSAEVREICEMLFPDLLLSDGQEAQEIGVVYSGEDLLEASWGCLKSCVLLDEPERSKCLANCKSKGGSKLIFRKE
ncbi:MAG TPA: hypothetical protein VKO43_09250, partial [Candidatus Krumholzibacteriaceae bacterium]|nr:hypothetical protein [Candidatus Krumholzibacteriaceae bacterium]